MLAYNEIIELRDKLVNGEISVELAQEQYWKDLKKDQRSWHTKDWKERREEFIKDQCEICGSQETLTLQHRWHPEKYNEYKRRITTSFTKDYIQNNPTIDQTELRSHVLKNYEYVPIPLCPNCKSRKPNKRMRKLPPYLCTVCRYEFDATVYRSVDELISIFYANEEAMEVRDKCFLTKDKWRNKHNLSDVRYWLQRERAKKEYNELLETEIFLSYLNDNIKYLSFEDTITACKKCAANYDLNKLELCPKCKVHYKGIQYSTCIQCLPEAKRKAALDKIEYGKAHQAMHRRLGID